MMSATTWAQQLQDLGFDAQVTQLNMVRFPFTIPVGPHLGTETEIAIAVPDQQIEPPTGIHVMPCLLPMHPEQDVGHPVGGVHPAPHLGDQWQYWSRPFVGWLESTRDAAAYLRHMHHLFATL